jgi:hypothetical protein
MLNPFDPIPDLATMLHDDSCAGRHDATIRPSDCLAALEAAEQLRSQLVKAGLALAPLHAVQWIERTFGDLTGEHPAETPPATMSGSESRAREQVWIEVRFRNSKAPARLGPYQRAWAELCLTEMNFSHDESMAGAHIVPEAAWIGRLLDEMA